MKKVIRTIAGILPVCLCLSNAFVFGVHATQEDTAVESVVVIADATAAEPAADTTITEDQNTVPPAQEVDTTVATDETIPQDEIVPEEETTVPETTVPETTIPETTVPNIDPVVGDNMQNIDNAMQVEPQLDKQEPIIEELEVATPTTVQELLELADTVNLGNVENDTYREALATLLGGDEIGFPLLPQEIRDRFATMEETLKATLKNTDLHMQIYFVKNAEGDRSPVLYAAHTGVITGAHSEKWKAVGVYNAAEDLWYISTAAHTYRKTIEGRDVAKLRNFIGTEEAYTMLQNTEEWIPVGTATEEPDNNNPVIPDNNNPVVPDDNNPVVPDDNNPVVPDDNNPVVPDDNDPVVPDNNNPVIPDDNNPVVPDDNNPVVPDEDNTTTPGEDTEIEIEEDDVPLGNLPETTQPEQDTVVEEVIIADQEVPMAQAPVQETPVETTEELIIVETEVPLGNLPNTGTPVNTSNGLAGLALFASIAATGAFVLSRKAD